jgi:peptidoglycan/xylan/chitin deacetylase (PgdA/CDA1 family)
MGDDLVLCYHAVTDGWPHELSVGPDALGEQVESLVRRGYRGVPFSEIGRGDGRVRRLAVTFDDGYVSVHDEALPVLERLGVPGTVFLPTDWVGRAEPMSWDGIADAAAGPHADALRCLTWEQAAALVDRGWEMGSHTCSHPRLTRCDDDALARELRASREVLAGRLGACPTIAYPYGDVDARVMEATRAAGYALAGALPARWHRPDPMAWPRVGVWRDDPPWRFRVKASPLVRRVRGGLGR